MGGGEAAENSSRDGGIAMTGAWWTLPLQIASGLIGADVIRWAFRLAAAAVAGGQ